MRFSVLASGSKANATIVEADGFRVLIDCGLSLRELDKRLGDRGLGVRDIDCLLVTHFHSDHVHGVPSLLNRYAPEVFARKGFQSLVSEECRWNQLRADHEIAIGPLYVRPFSLPHDDGGSFGFHIQHNRRSLVYATDLGEATGELQEVLSAADGVIIESNHDRAMLQSCLYPAFVKSRIASAMGHLSNCQSAELLNRHLASTCQHVVLAHLSERANCPNEALKCVSSSINVPVTCASQREGSDWYSVEKNQPQRAEHWI